MHRALLAAMALLGTIGTASAASPSAPVSSGDVDWSGFYAGVNSGYSRGTFNYDDGSSESIDLGGLFVGGQIGFNFVLVDNVVLGVQADGDWSNQHGNFTSLPFAYSDNFRTDWTGSATAHLGVTTGPLMLYGLAGVVVAHGSEDYTEFLVGSSTGSASGTQLGWTAGIGAEARIDDHVGAFLEARYTSYKSASFPGTWSGGTWTLSGTEADWSVRSGVNFHF